ncbi:hypothetical protein G3M48_008789 [Beauveria asiatica]|uniref:Uncharacterized protein n=1 Tax=Beauveria asiatica TaxID=1069075 RepID=A0AAW0S2W2_9HYPO
MKISIIVIPVLAGDALSNDAEAVVLLSSLLLKKLDADSVVKLQTDALNTNENAASKDASSLANDALSLDADAALLAESVVKLQNDALLHISSLLALSLAELW